MARQSRRVGQVPQDVELVEDDPGVLRVAVERVAEGSPHVHRRQFDPRRRSRPRPLLRCSRPETQVHGAVRLFSLPGFVAEARLLGVFGDRYARIVVLRRRKKRPRARAAGIDAAADTISARAVCVERMDWLAKNPRYTARYALHVGALCREMTNQAVAVSERLHHRTVKD